jgi:GNAT superfamily N-acetyltransferase
MTPSIQRLQELPPDGLAELVTESERHGFRFLRRLTEEWASGINCFALPGEGLFIATSGGQTIGVCGLNIDPYTAEKRVGRVRHLYVLSAYRRNGIGGQLVREIITTAKGVFDQLRLRTENPEAARFYEGLGFRPCIGQDICTHVLMLLSVAEPSQAGT